MTQAFTVFLEGFVTFVRGKISGQEANVEQKQESIHIKFLNTFFSNMKLKLFGE